MNFMSFVAIIHLHLILVFHISLVSIPCHTACFILSRKEEIDLSILPFFFFVKVTYEECLIACFYQINFDSVFNCFFFGKKKYIHAFLHDLWVELVQRSMLKLVSMTKRWTGIRYHRLLSMICAIDSWNFILKLLPHLIEFGLPLCFPCSCCVVYLNLKFYVYIYINLM